jgi:3-oxoacyl-[acyl-carrier-protein] synthase III
MAVKSLIESLGVYIPKQSLSTEEVLRGCTNRPDIDLEGLTGIKNRPIVAEGEYSIDLAIKAATKCFEISRYEPKDLDLIISTNISRYAGPNFRFPAEPSTSAKLAAHFNASKATFFDVSNACAGMMTGVQIMDSYIKAGLIKRGMVVSGEYITHLMRNAQKEIGQGLDPQLASLTVGDSGAAIILEATDDPRFGFHYIDLFTAAEFCDLCIGTTSSKEHGGYVMYTDSSSILNEGIRLSLDHIEEMLADRTCADMRFDWYLLHQVANGQKSKTNVLERECVLAKRPSITYKNAVTPLRPRILSLFGTTFETARYALIKTFLLPVRHRGWSPA